jgi:hypothetical protein
VCEEEGVRERRHEFATRVRDLPTLFPVDNAHFLDRHLRAASKKKEKRKKLRVKKNKKCDMMAD